MYDREFEVRMKNAIDHNRMVYDSGADYLTSLTKRLVYLMYNESKSRMTKLYIPPDSFPEWEWATTQGPVEIVRDERFCSDNACNLITKWDIEMPIMYNGLVLGTWGSESALLGAIKW